MAPISPFQCEGLGLARFEHRSPSGSAAITLAWHWDTVAGPVLGALGHSGTPAANICGPWLGRIEQAGFRYLEGAPMR